MNILREKLGVEIPIVQAPMAGISTPALAGAVSNAGALGSLGIGAMTTENARLAIQQTRAITERAFNVNVFCHTTAPPDPAVDERWLTWLSPCFKRFNAAPPTELKEIYTSFNRNEAMLAMLLEERPAVVSFHFGLPPASYASALHGAGIMLIASATSQAEARRCEESGIDAVIAQGIEAGGHRGTFNPEAPDEGLGLLALTRLLASQGSLPVIAAGGIMDGPGIRSALSAGAIAAQLGTAFIPCTESAADAAYRSALLSGASTQTVLTRAISGRDARGLQNKLTELGAKPDCPTIPGYPFAYDASKALNAAAKAGGCADFAPHWAGQGFRLCRAMPAAELISTLQKELNHNPILCG